nr:hypothetical protein CFP56_38427 [Quercus suber]
MEKDDDGGSELRQKNILLDLAKRTLSPLTSPSIQLQPSEPKTEMEDTNTDTNKSGSSSPSGSPSRTGRSSTISRDSTFQSILDDGEPNEDDESCATIDGSCITIDED